MTKHIIIIGGGVVGRCTAYYAARYGHRVTLLERHAPDHPGCSFGNAGLVTPSHFVPLAAPGMVALGFKWMLNPESPFYVQPRLRRDLVDWGWKFYRASREEHVRRSAPLLRDLNMASRDCFEELGRDSGRDFGYERRGCLMLCNTEHRFEHEKTAAEEGKRLGLATEILSADEVARLEPKIRMNIVGAVHFLDDAHLVPNRFMAMLEQLLQENRVTCRWKTEVTGWTLNGSTIEGVNTPEGNIRGDEYVITGGAWTPALVRSLDVNLPMQAGKGYSLTLSEPRYLSTFPAICTEARLAVTAMGRSLRFGGTMEIAGLNETINPARVRGILKSVTTYYPDFTADDFRDIKPWCGLRPVSPDGLPYIGRIDRYTNLSVGTGHAMMGLSLGPITGKLLTQVLSLETPSLDIGQLSPMRYDSKKRL